MAKPRVDAAGGFPAIAYTFRKAREAGGYRKFWGRMRSRNACKTCAFGMGGQAGGMVNEAGHFPEVCKKSLQAQAGDMQPPIDEAFFASALDRRAAGLDAAAAGVRRAHRLPGDRRARRHALPPPRLGRGVRPRGGRAPRHDAGPHLLLRLGTLIQRGGLPAAGPGATVRLPPRAQLLELLPSSLGRRARVACSAPARRPSCSTIIDRADVALVVGANPASNHPRLIVKLVDVRKRGGKVIVINPVRELGLQRFKIPSKAGSLFFGSTVSDHYLQPNVGSDIVLLKGLLKGVLERDAIDTGFTTNHVDGWDAVDRGRPPARLGDDRRALRCARASRSTRRPPSSPAARTGCCSGRWGLTHHEHGVDNILALGNLALSRGWLGRQRHRADADPRPQQRPGRRLGGILARDSKRRFWSASNRPTASRRRPTAASTPTGRCARPSAVRSTPRS